jgi:hypothetical protein
MLPAFFNSIGADHWLTAADASATWYTHPLMPPTWEVYQAQFQGFTGATVDPQFHRLAHPASQVGSIGLEPGSSVVVVGTGPSLRTEIHALGLVRDHVRIFTSPRGAEALLPHGIVPDLVLIEHQTALDAHHSARGSADREAAVLARCPLVAADWRTPANLLTSVPASALFVPAPLPSWGLWPATAVALAMNAGAARVALLGVDLGTMQRRDPAYMPLVAVLELLSRLGTAVTIDCGIAGTSKAGWIKTAMMTAAGGPVTGPVVTKMRPAPSRRERLAAARDGLLELLPVIERARAQRELGLKGRAGRAAGVAAALGPALQEMMAWGQDARIRLLVQETLGAAFLPRLWRLTVAPALGAAAWRPLLLASHELVGQAEALAAAIAMDLAA